MKTHNDLLEIIANDFLEQNAAAKGNENKPNYSNRDFMNAVIIFQNALMDKMFDLQTAENMSFDDRSKMAVHCGNELRKFIQTYTGLDTHEFEKFI